MYKKALLLLVFFFSFFIDVGSVFANHLEKLKIERVSCPFSVPPGKRYAVFGVTSEGKYPLPGTLEEHCILVDEQQSTVDFSALMSAGVIDINWSLEDVAPQVGINCSGTINPYEPRNIFKDADSISFDQKVKDTLYELKNVDTSRSCFNRHEGNTVYFRYRIEASDGEKYIYFVDFFSPGPPIWVDFPTGPVSVLLGETAGPVTIRAFGAGDDKHIEYTCIKNCFPGIELATSGDGSATIRVDTNAGQLPRGILPFTIQARDTDTQQTITGTIDFIFSIACAERTRLLNCTGAGTPEQCKQTCQTNKYCSYIDNECKSVDEFKGSDAIQKRISDTYKKPDGYTGPIPDCAWDGTCRNINDLLQFAVNVTKYLFGFVGTVAFAFFVYGGFTIVLSMGSSDKVGKGRDILIAAVIGIIISFSAYVAVDFVLDALQVGDDFRQVGSLSGSSAPAVSGTTQSCGTEVSTTVTQCLGKNNGDSCPFEAGEATVPGTCTFDGRGCGCSQN